MPQLSSPARGVGLAHFRISVPTVLMLVTLLASVTLIPTGPAAAVTLALGAASGTPGTTVTFTGTGFGAGRPLTVTWDGAAVTLPLTTTNAQDGFTLSFAAPRSKGGNHTVKISDRASSLDSTWAMESTAPPGPLRAETR